MIYYKSVSKNKDLLGLIQYYYNGIKIHLNIEELQQN